jgi:hypothetical protein
MARQRFSVIGVVLVGMVCAAGTAYAKKCVCTGTCGEDPKPVAPHTITCPSDKVCGCTIDCTVNPPTATASCDTPAAA